MSATATEVLQANIKSSRDARELVELAGEQPQRFWECLIQLCEEKLPPKPMPFDRNPPMDDAEASAFERKQTMPRGLYVGKAVGDVPVAYLFYWTEPDEFTKLLFRYVRSKTFARRQDEDAL